MTQGEGAHESDGDTGTSQGAPTSLVVWELLSEPRMAPYLRVADDDRARALDLYEWSCRTASAAFEIVGHLEVLMRNALDRALAEHFRERAVGIPWFLLPAPGGESVAEQVETVRSRLRPRGQESRHQIVAGLSFGFWSGLLGSRYEELWRDAVRHAFPYSDGRRKQVSSAVERVRKFRNRLAHHDSMVNVDVPFEIRQVVELAGFIDPAAARWLEQCSRAMDVYRERPVTIEDTVVVPAPDAWPLYEGHRAYVSGCARLPPRREDGFLRGPADHVGRAQDPAPPGRRGVDGRGGGTPRTVVGPLRPPDSPPDPCCPPGRLDRRSVPGVPPLRARRPSTPVATTADPAPRDRTRICVRPAPAVRLSARARDGRHHRRPRSTWMRVGSAGGSPVLGYRSGVGRGSPRGAH